MTHPSLLSIHHTPRAFSYYLLAFPFAWIVLLHILHMWLLILLVSAQMSVLLSSVPWPLELTKPPIAPWPSINFISFTAFFFFKKPQFIIIFSYSYICYCLSFHWNETLKRIGVQPVSLSQSLPLPLFYSHPYVLRTRIYA